MESVTKYLPFRDIGTFVGFVVAVAVAVAIANRVPGLKKLV